MDDDSELNSDLKHRSRRPLKRLTRRLIDSDNDNNKGDNGNKTADSLSSDEEVSICLCFFFLAELDHECTGNDLKDTQHEHHDVGHSKKKNTKTKEEKTSKGSKHGQTKSRKKVDIFLERILLILVLLALTPPHSQPTLQGLKSRHERPKIQWWPQT